MLESRVTVCIVLESRRQSRSEWEERVKQAGEVGRVGRKNRRRG